MAAFRIESTPEGSAKQGAEKRIEGGRIITQPEKALTDLAPVVALRLMQRRQGAKGKEDRRILKPRELDESHG